MKVDSGCGENRFPRFNTEHSAHVLWGYAKNLRTFKSGALQTAVMSYSGRKKICFKNPKSELLMHVKGKENREARRVLKLLCNGQWFDLLVVLRLFWVFQPRSYSLRCSCQLKYVPELGIDDAGFVSLFPHLTGAGWVKIAEGVRSYVSISSSRLNLLGGSCTMDEL